VRGARDRAGRKLDRGGGEQPEAEERSDAVKSARGGERVREEAKGGSYPERRREMLWSLREES
jgi:hypothetical protein